MTSHCMGAVQMREESQRSKKMRRRDLTRQQKMEREGGQQQRVMEDCSTDKRLDMKSFMCSKRITLWTNGIGKSVYIYLEGMVVVKMMFCWRAGTVRWRHCLLACCVQCLTSSTSPCSGQFWCSTSSFCLRSPWKSRFVYVSSIMHSF